jgi:uncharacterized protein (TIGR03083 family)
VDKSRYLACLESDYQRLRAVAKDAAAAPVPSCPEWTMADLVRHVAEVYVDKTETMRQNAEQSWPPALAGDDPLTALDGAYAALVAELTTRPFTETTLTWYGPDQTVGFWVRRMAQETVIHRVDAEQAAGAELAPIPDDLAVDGIDEVLVRFLSYMSFEYPKMLGERLTGCDGRAVLVDAGHTRWSVRLAPGGLAVSTGPFEATAARVSGTPTEVLLWLWRRADDSAVKVDGDTELVETLREMMGDATQ